MRSVLFACNLTSLFLGLSNVAFDTCTEVAAADAYCPVKKLLTCKNVHDLKCSPKIWHGIDSLEVFEISYFTKLSVKITSLNGTFKDTIANVLIRPKNGEYSGNPLIVSTPHHFPPAKETAQRNWLHISAIQEKYCPAQICNHVESSVDVNGLHVWQLGPCRRTDPRTCFGYL